MLEEVGIQIFVRKGQVQLNIIRELNDLEVNALFSKFGLHDLKNICVRHRGSPAKLLAFEKPIFKVSAAFAVPKKQKAALSAAVIKKLRLFIS